MMYVFRIVKTNKNRPRFRDNRLAASSSSSSVFNL